MTIDCNSILYHVCVSNNDQYTFNISSTASTWRNPQVVSQLQEHMCVLHEHIYVNIITVYNGHCISR